MLAGVGGIDLVLFVIAADESIKPQTREHFHICRLLHIPRGIVVLTKSDLVDSDILELVRLEVDEFVRGSFLEDAPVVAVSSTTGLGLDTLRHELKQAASSIHEKDASRYFRLPLDRAFSMRGFGTVITGTLISGSVGTEQEVEIFPARERVRVRGIQVHGASQTRALAGQRTALNLAGIEPASLARGMMLAEAGRFAATKQVDAVFDLLASATRAYVRLTLREPLQLLPGDRFIVRMFSPVVTIGGGMVLDIGAPRRSTAERLQTLEKGSVQEKLALLISESKSGMGMPDLIARTGLLASEIAAAAQQPALTFWTEPQFWVVDNAWMQARLETIQATLKQFHREKPLLAGLSKEELRGKALPGAPAFLLDALLARSKTISAKGEIVHLMSHQVALRQDEAEAIAKIEAAFQSAGLAVPSTPEVLAKSGVEPARARTLLQILLRDKKLVRVSDDLVFHATAISTLKSLLEKRKGQGFAVPEFKDWTGISRKYAIPLLEFLDREKLTRRDGDTRIVL